jgi:hypothetical protein
MHTHVLLGACALECSSFKPLGAYALECLSFTCWGFMPWDALTIQIVGGLCPGMLSIQRA